MLSALKYHRWGQLPRDFHHPGAVCFTLLAVIDGPALLHHKTETSPILQTPAAARGWRGGVIYHRLAGLCKLQGCVYRLNVQQEHPAKGRGISLQRVTGKKEKEVPFLLDVVHHREPLEEALPQYSLAY